MADKLNIQYRIQAVDRFSKTMKRLDKQLDNLERKAQKLEKVENINVNITGAQKAVKQLEKVEDKADQIPRLKVTHVLVSGYKNYRRNMDRLADSLRDFDEIASGIAKGGVFTALPTLVPITGVLAGGVGAVASSFGAAGAAAAGFGAVAIPALSGVFKAQKALNEAQKAVDNASNAEERAEALEQLNAVQAKYNDTQWRGVKALQSFTDYYKKFAKEFEKPVIETFIRSLDGLRTTLDLAKPAIDGAVQAVSNLVDSFNANLKTDDVKAFFTWLGDSGGQNLETVTKALGNFGQGLLNMLVAFDPLAQSFNEGFLKMSERFREWSATLSENQAFQNFMNFVKENTPTVLSLVGNIITTLVNIGEAMAPFATKVLEMANSFFAWTSEVTKNNEVLGVLIGVGTMAIGLFKMFAPFIMGVVSAFKTMMPFISKAWTWIGKLGGIFTKTFPKIAMFGARVMSLTNPIGIAINIVILLATIVISNWDKIWAWTKKIFGKVKDWIAQKWQQIENTFEVVKAIAKTVGNKFSDIYNAVKEKLGDVWDTVKSIWGQVEDFLGGIDLFEMGKNIIDGLIKGIGHMAGALVDKAKGVVNGAIEGAKNLLGINSPSKVFQQFGLWTGEGFIKGMDAMTDKVARSSRLMTSAAMTNVASQRTSFTPKPSGSSAASQAVSENNGETNRLLRQLVDATKAGHTIVMNDREVGRAVEPEVSKVQARKTKLKRRFKGAW